MTKLTVDQMVTAASPGEAGAGESAEDGDSEACRAAALHFVLGPEYVEAFTERLDRLSGLRAMRAQFQTIVLDTQDHAIASAGLQFGIRRRMIGGRGGWKRILEDLSTATPRSARRQFKDVLRQGHAIVATAQIATKRRFWLLRFGDCRADITLDHMIAATDEKQVALASVTFATPAANSDFFDFVTAAFDPERLRPSAESDLQRIYRLFGEPLAPYALAFPPVLRPRMDAAAALRATASACFDQFLLNEAAIRATGDHEAVHQCRVALRRLSACFKFFGTFVEGADRDALLADFRDIRNHLRIARDLDVLIATVIAPAVAADPSPDAKALLDEIAQRRAHAHEDLASLLRRPASAALFLRFALWLHDGDWCSSPEAKSRKHRATSITAYAERKFALLNQKFLAACAALGEATAEERHATRIRAKNMRYDAEFMESLARGKAAQKRRQTFLKAVKDLQTVLGDWNDLLVAREFLLSFQAGGDQPENAALHAAAARIAEHIHLIDDESFRKKSAHCCQALVDSRPFWSKLG